MSDDDTIDGATLIATERKRQIEEMGWSLEHDDGHTGGELAAAGAAYAWRYVSGINTATDYPPAVWPFERELWHPTPDDPIRQLTKAGALIAAEIDRLLRDD